MRVPKPKLRTNSLSQESKFIYFAFLNFTQYRLFRNFDKTLGGIGTVTEV